MVNNVKMTCNKAGMHREERDGMEKKACEITWVLHHGLANRPLGKALSCPSILLSALMCPSYNLQSYTSHHGGGSMESAVWVWVGGWVVKVFPILLNIFRSLTCIINVRQQPPPKSSIKKSSPSFRCFTRNAVFFFIIIILNIGT